MYGFHGRLLHIDLSTRQSSWRELEEARLRAFLGGIGLGTSLLYEFAPPGVDPFAPANPLIFTSAPLVGTGLTTTAKFAVVTKSPLTGFIADSLSSSHFALELKRLGLDALVITGQAASTVYIYINDQEVEIRAAEPLRGKSPCETEALIRSELNSPAVCVAAIGKAGENRVRFATISNEGRHAGRGGVGAVMGSKNLKAIAVCGGRETQVADSKGIEAIADSLRQRSLGSLTDKYRKIGTVANLAVFNRLGTLPTRNFQQSTFDHAEALSGESLTEHNFSRRHGCASCTIRCERLFKALNGAEQRLEYETLFALGPLCGIKDPEVVLQAAQLCDLYGLDTISTGGTLSWAMECSEKGLLPEAQDLRFGEPNALLAAIPLIARREGLGALLAEGSKRAAVEIGGASLYWAMHVKGLELPGYEPRSLKTMALGLAVSPRGACHNRSGAYEADFSGEVDRLRADAGRGALVAASEDFAAVLDSLIVCKFLRKCFTDFYGEGAELLSKVTGWDCSSDELRRIGERIHNLKKLFNMREGWRSADDWLPERLLSETLPTGVAQGTGLTSNELREMLQGYYQARGWDQNGLVPEKKLRELGLTRDRVQVVQNVPIVQAG
ncbi:MAG: aldehyde ferredoxin oxidoreductase family protein [Deltaproteobacteria bacterium]|nr:aldehyde ferredoxin oxidoreductase family protein [Deltaproteobacteria bacterium]MBI2182499.1 aldehyde ferredoxin oxidoreductase family protein [Deltaproteobacteria bacterium]MBI2228608.1 aldehyde ferredoxin oxidoreductase family protein [Deltaproteobacteria bacterium]MBI2534993.1 aldehyde ferredoxin oxidoreductase family protein [Deltaproteobacteria bacterium]MBI3063438.1 aldehyde ferredoxin oxidoreductase family protein [Deltaproteobacteria bacterium]